MKKGRSFDMCVLLLLYFMRCEGTGFVKHKGTGKVYITL